MSGNSSRPTRARTFDAKRQFQAPGGSEGAIVATDPNHLRGGGRIPVAVFAVRPKLEHGNPPHPRVFPITVFANDEARAIVGLRDIAVQNIDELVRDQIRAHIGSKFKGHALARLIAAVLEAEGYVTSVSSPGKYGGVKFLAGLGSLGLDAPRLCVQMKLGSETERRYRARRPPRHDAETSKPITGCSSVGAG